MKNSYQPHSFFLLAVLILSALQDRSFGQSFPKSHDSTFAASAFSATSADLAEDPYAERADTDPLPAAPEPATLGAGDHYEVAPAATWHQIPFSRVGIGANISPLGIGIESAIVLNHYFDGRVMVNFFNYDTGRFEVEGFNVDAKIHMLSTAAALDFYPLGSVFRISPGVMFYNGNQVSGSTDIVPGTSFTLDGRTYYSASANPATGATPLVGTGALVLHANRPAFTLTGGFGHFIPHSNRHWSFPFEIGVALIGAPTINVKATGWACLNAQQTDCSDIGDPTNPIAIAFNNSLQGQLDKWRTDLGKVTVYPMISSSVVYSFNIR